jgi:hypothetical protein
LGIFISVSPTVIELALFINEIQTKNKVNSIRMVILAS